ncbi:glutamate-rich protein 2 isoform X3 [Cavia porcellus]|uniref:glutamate-rich protein 2 isoform X3 n=1 Tax=Cavia porcellus TaxID=10141 RepID=UPI002FE0B88F
MIQPKEAKSHKCLFGQRPRLASKLYSSPTRVSLSVAKPLSEKKDVSSKKTEKKVSKNNTEKRITSRSTEKKDILNLQSNLWSSYLKESTGEEGKDAVIAKQEKVDDYCLQDTDKLSESTNDDKSYIIDEDSKNGTRAPLELMAEFLRAEMGRDYHLAKKLCQMKEAQNLEENEEDSEEDSSTESEDSSEDPSGESSDERKDGP